MISEPTPPPNTTSPASPPPSAEKQNAESKAFALLESKLQDVSAISASDKVVLQRDIDNYYQDAVQYASLYEPDSAVQQQLLDLLTEANVPNNFLATPYNSIQKERLTFLYKVALGNRQVTPTPAEYHSAVLQARDTFLQQIKARSSYASVQDQMQKQKSGGREGKKNSAAITRLRDFRKRNSLLFTNLAFAAALIFLFGVVLFLYSMQYGSDTMDAMIQQMRGDSAVSPTQLASNFMTKVAYTLALTAIVSGLNLIIHLVFEDIELNVRNISGVVATSGVITFFVVGLTMIAVDSVPLLRRAFENTFGYMRINGESLTALTRKIYTNKFNPDLDAYQNFNVLITPLYMENFSGYLELMQSGNPVSAPTSTSPSASSSTTQKGGAALGSENSEETKPSSSSASSSSSSSPSASTTLQELRGALFQAGPSTNPFVNIVVRDEFFEAAKEAAKGFQLRLKTAAELRETTDGAAQTIREYYEYVMQKRKWSESVWIFMGSAVSLCASYLAY